MDGQQSDQTDQGMLALRWLVPVFRSLTARNFVRIEQKGRPGPL